MKYRIIKDSNHPETKSMLNKELSRKLENEIL